MRINIINIPSKYHSQIKKTVGGFIKAQRINPDCTINIEFASKAKIKRLNKKYRQINEPTDVLSFPIWESKEKIPQKGAVCLGDIVICPEMTDINKGVEKVINHSLGHLGGKHH